MAPMHSGFLEEYPLIRVDNFTATLPRLPWGLSPACMDDLPPGSTHFSPPHISLLSHPHTDHLAGLGSLTRQSAPIYCSEVTKRLLLALERKADRERYDQGKGPKKCPYRTLRKGHQECQILEKQSGTSGFVGWDLLHPLRFNTPVLLSYTARTSIRLTLLPANHMPGSTMFLVEGERGAVLHTGDVRAEEHFIQALLVRSHLCRLSLRHTDLYVSPRLLRGSRTRSDKSSESDSRRNKQLFTSSPRLVNLYLDTERLLDVGVPLTKSEAIFDAIQLLRLFPRSMRVHINCWTSGYEEFLLSLSNAFPEERDGNKIHLDRYKNGLYRIMSVDPAFAGLPELVSTSKMSCGRFCICDEAACLELVDLTVEAHEGMDASQWQASKQSLLSQISKARKEEGPWPTTIPLPLQRHSPLREIYSMIKHLQPVKVTANTATCAARFVLARISEQLQLTGAVTEAERQERLEGPQGRADVDKWRLCHQAWKESGTSALAEAELAFFERVVRFRLLLRAASMAESDRIPAERMYAAAEEATTLYSTSPWSNSGRYAATDLSPFLTPAMRTEAAAAAAEESPLPSRIATEPPGEVLTVEKSSRYLAYASMFLGWRIRNPSRYRPDIAWKAIRKMKPALARQSEEALFLELGMIIPAWDTTDTAKPEGTKVMQQEVEEQAPSLHFQPKTLSLLATANGSIAPSTPTKASRPHHESISPLQLGAAALLHRLQEEVASQEFGYSNAAGLTSDVELVHVAIIEDANCSSSSEHASAPIPISFDYASLEGLLRQTMSEGTKSDRIQPLRGLHILQRILQEWQQPSKELKMVRLRHQLNIVGAAARSRRGRKMLSWDSVDFTEALQTLQALYSPSRLGLLPRRGRVVLRHLRAEVERAARRC